MLRFCALTTSSVNEKTRIKELSIMSSIAWRRDQHMFIEVRRTYALSFMLGGIMALSLCLKSSYFATQCVQWAL